MPKRVTIPGLIDVCVVDEPDHVQWLNAHPKVTRSLNPAAGIVQRVLNQRMTSDLRFTRGILPVFSRREVTERARNQAELRARLDQRAGAITPEVFKLSNYVAGAGGDDQLGVTVQQWCGRLFFPDYVATRDTYRAGDLIARWPTIDPVRSLAYKASGTLEKAKTTLEQAAKGDLNCVHSTSIGTRNIVGSLRTLRLLAREPRDPKLNVGDRAVLFSLMTPNAVVRSCLDEVSAPFLDKPLSAQTVLVFPVATMFAATHNPDVAFMSQGWNACPARGAVLGLLKSVWEMAGGAAHEDPNDHAAANGGNGIRTNGAAPS
jgi:hypothetical protein